MIDRLMEVRFDGHCFGCGPLNEPLKLGETVRVVGKVENVRRSLVYASAYVENRDDGSRIADATATLMEVKTQVDAELGGAHGPAR